MCFLSLYNKLIWNALCWVDLEQHTSIIQVLAMIVCVFITDPNFCTQRDEVEVIASYVVVVLMISCL